MADVTIDGSVITGTSRGMRSVVFTSASIGYWFYADSDGSFCYSKTTDSGATWGARVQIHTATNKLSFDVWFDQWTPADSGTLIHTWYFDTVFDVVFYRTLDTASDTLGTERTVFSGASAVAGRGTFVSGTKCKSGYLYAAYDIDAGAEKGFKRSTDGGPTWSAVLSATFVEATIDECLLFPACNTGDNNDCLALYHDASTDELTLKLWDSSGAAASESSVIATVIENVNDLTGQRPFSASLRHSDGKIIASMVTDYDTATADHRVFVLDCTAPSTFSITELTAITTNIDDHYHPAVFIDQLTDDIYVAYNGKRDGSEVLGTTTKVYYTKSTDDGTTWSAGDTAYMEGAAGVVVQTWAPLMGARFFVGWRVGTTLIGNAVNSLGLLTAQATDDVLIRLGPGLTTVVGSGLVTPLFTVPGGGGAVLSPFYYNMMQEWFASN